MPIDRNAQAWDADGLTELKLAAVAALIGVAAAVIFVGWPDLDLAVARLFYIEPRHFLFNQSALATMLRFGFRLVTWTTATLAVIGIILVLAKRRHLLGLGLPQWIFLALVLITGPGLIANTLLKDHWARPRPIQVVEFGGPDRFTTVLERSGSCERNCSFVSGEASATFAIGFAIAMLARRRRCRADGRRRDRGQHRRSHSHGRRRAFPERCGVRRRVHGARRGASPLARVPRPPAKDAGRSLVA